VTQPTAITARPHPRGGSVLLSWTNPVVQNFKGTRVLRKELNFPVVPDDIGTKAEIYNDAATPQGGTASFLDAGLKNEVVYYYAVVSYDSAGNDYPAFVSAMSSSPYESGAYLYTNLPGLYQTYDTALPPAGSTVDPADLTKGQLRRLLEMFGAEFDLLRSFASGMRSFFDPAQVDGVLLPLLSSWIGWPTDNTLSLPKQRNEVRFAPHYYATTGIPANLRAMINRVSTWDARIKEFAYSIFLSNLPDQLTIWEQERIGNNWQSEQVVTLDAAYEGRPAAVQNPNDERLWLFYHARQSASAPTTGAVVAQALDRFHLNYKVFEQGVWAPSHRLTASVPIAGVSATNRSPSVVFRSDSSFWVFWSSLDDSGNNSPSRLRLLRCSMGRTALIARIVGTVSAPFPLTDGDVFQIVIGTGSAAVARRVIFRTEDFNDITHATVGEVVALLDRELPGVDVSAAPDGSIVIVSRTAGSASVLTVPFSSASPKLGLSSPPPGIDATAALLIGTALGPFALQDGDTLIVTIDNDVPRLITFSANSFPNIAAATADEVVAVINSVFPGSASNQAGKVQIASLSPGADSLVSVDISLSTAASILGFGQPPPSPPAGIDETEPSAFEDGSQNLWLFWSSRRDGSWKIWYSRLAAGAWANPRPLTTTAFPDRECSAVLDQAGGRMWVFWSRKKDNGLWNIFFRNTTTLDFNTQTQATWGSDVEWTPVPGSYDNREPAAVVVSKDNLEVFYSSNQSGGWNLWSGLMTGTVQGAQSQVTTGQYTRRTAVPLLVAPNRMHLWFRNNEVLEHDSTIYPAARTIDGRYAGSTTVDTRNLQRLGLRGNIQDINRYTYETSHIFDDSLAYGINDVVTYNDLSYIAIAPSKGPDNPTPDQNSSAWKLLGAVPASQQEAARLYSRDTIGIYLTPDTNDEELIFSTLTQLKSLSQTFLPIQTRVVFLIDQAFTESVYPRRPLDTLASTVPADRVVDTILSEVVPPFDDSFMESTVDFHFLKTWVPGQSTGKLLDSTISPLDLSFRLLLAHVDESP
jgi:phage tail-like protein